MRKTVSAGVAILMTAAMSFGLGGCDNFSNLTANCQVGVRVDQTHIAGCQFSNTGSREASGCIKVHVTRPGIEGDPLAGDDKTYVSEKLCVDGLEPGAQTEALALGFDEIEATALAKQCVHDEDGKQVFHCELAIEETAKSGD